MPVFEARNARVTQGNVTLVYDKMTATFSTENKKRHYVGRTRSSKRFTDSDCELKFSGPARTNQTVFAVASKIDALQCVWVGVDPANLPKDIQHLNAGVYNYFGVDKNEYDLSEAEHDLEISGLYEADGFLPDPLADGAPQDVPLV